MINPNEYGSLLFDEKEKERRKQEQIAYRNRKNTTNLFLIVGTIVEVIITFTIVMALVLLTVLIIQKINLDDTVKANIFQFAAIADLIGGIILGLNIYKALGRWVIKKWNLQDKLREDTLIHFKTRKEYKEYYEKQQHR